jgi:glycosyltransferase involved in cell wall biosynthesis
VLHVIDGLGMGGAERLLVPLLSELASRGWDVRVCALSVRGGNPIAEELVKRGVPVDVVPVGKLRNLRQALRLARYIRQLRPDVVHGHLEFASTLGTLSAWVLGIPSVCTLHTEETPAPGSRSERRLRFAWWVMRRACDRVLCVSERTKRHYLDSGRIATDRLVTLHNGIDLDPFTPPGGMRRDPPRQALGLAPDAKVLMTVAVLREEKGIQHMLAALPGIARAEPKTRYLVVGEGPHREAIEAGIAELDLGDRVTLLGQRDDIPQLLAAADAFVLPTLTEALPTVLMEAMASSLPIVASSVGGVPEMVEHEINGFLVEPERAEQLEEACVALLRDAGLRERFGLAGRRLVEERFDVRLQARRLGELYEELMSSRGGAAA